MKRKGDDKPVIKAMGGGMMYKKGGTPKKKMKKKIRILRKFPSYNQFNKN